MDLEFKDYLRLGLYLRYSAERDAFLKKYRFIRAEH
jgi:hypothetical protein